MTAIGPGIEIAIIPFGFARIVDGMANFTSARKTIA